MSEPSESTKITPQQFLDSDGVEDWRVVGEVASTCFRGGSFAAGVRLAEAVGELVGTGDRHAEMDVRQLGVTVRLITITDDYYGLTTREVELARQISAAARQLGVPADPSVVQGMVINIGALVRPDIVPFWRAVLDFQPRADNPGEELNDPRQLWPLAYFQQLDLQQPKRNRIHIDVFVPRDQAQQRVAAAVAAGGRITHENPPHGCVLEDAEGNEACIGTYE